MSAPLLLDEHVQHFRGRVVQDALCNALAAYWKRRAVELRWAQPRPGEYAGKATVEQLREQWTRLEEQARACESRARVAELGGEQW
jgi:hypothetical protein